jgi:ubiquinone/menaquinone biosynthesis C-methylase UbiE
MLLDMNKMRLKDKKGIDCSKRDSDFTRENDRLLWVIRHYSPKAKEVLDLGMGKGYLVNKLNENGFLAEGVDLRELGQKNMIVADAKFLPFNSNIFDVVIDCYTIADITDFQEYSIEDVYQIFREANRVLKKRGLFLTLPSIRPIEFFEEELNKSVWGAYRK